MIFIIFIIHNNNHQHITYLKITNDTDIYQPIEVQFQIMQKTFHCIGELHVFVNVHAVS